MSSPIDRSAHDATPEAAIAGLGVFHGPLLLDLDETLYLRNSTEDFIDCATPGFAAAVLLKILDWTRPWRWSGGEATRDVWRVRAIALFFPWTTRRWHARIPGLANRFANRPLAAALRTHPSPITIVTLGFLPIVTPLISALALGESRIVASRGSGFEDRRRGKLGLATDALGEATVRRSLVITDSIDDLPLLDACARGFRTLWPGSRYRSALDHVYLPGRYLSRVKRPGERYISRGILKEDFAIWLIGSIALAGAPIQHAVGLLFLLVSFWTIYECGYVDNDRVGAQYEAEPKLTAAFLDAPVATPRWEPWIWSSVMGVIALLLLRWPALPVIGDFARWLGVLLGTYGTFHLYNRLDKRTRVWLYAGLQLARSAAFTVLVPVPPAATLALAAHVLARWVPYYLYRSDNNVWPENPVPLLRLAFLAVLATLMALTQGVSQLLTWTSAALLAWVLIRAWVDLRLVVAQATRIDRFR